MNLDGSVPADQAELLGEDIKLMEQFSFNTTTDANIFGLSSLNRDSLIGWLSVRLGFIVGENYQLAGSSVSLGSQKPAIFADGITNMDNLGAVVYIAGRDSGKLYTLSIAGQMVPIKSPRVGLFRIGEGLFNYKKIGRTAPSAIGNRLLRLSTLLHEARHDDGNGSNTGMLHGTCTSGSLKGESACDKYSNGPYMIASAFLKACQQICDKQGCTSEEREGLKAYQADALSRLLPNATWLSDTRPEGFK